MRPNIPLIKEELERRQWSGNGMSTPPAVTVL